MRTIGPVWVVSGQMKASHHHHVNLTVSLMNPINLVHKLTTLANEIIKIAFIPPTCRCQLWAWKSGKRMKVDIVYEATHVPDQETTESKAPDS